MEKVLNMTRVEDAWKDVLSDAEKKKAYIAYVKRWEDSIHAFLEFDPEKGLSSSKKDGELSGIPCAVKDNIAVEGFRLSCGSKMLEHFVSPYSATAVKKLQESGVVVVGKTNLDEFGMGSSTENSALAVTSNPWDVKRVPGGSSGGSAAAVAAGLVPFALGTDTGGSIRQPASFCGVYGLKPTYGVVSRFGLVAYASSLETIGVLSGDIGLLRTVFSVMKGMDSNDQSTVEYVPLRCEGGRLKIGVLKGKLDLSPLVETAYKTMIGKAKAMGFQIVEIELPTLEYVVPAYYTIATAEASANLARYTGIRYGLRPDFSENQEELVMRSRDSGFGPEVKLRILLGTYVLRSGFQDQYYLRAQKIRTAIRNDFSRAFSAADIVLMPVFPTPAFLHGDPELDPFKQKLADKFTCTANLAGIPGLTIPAGVYEGLPVGMQILAPAFGEDLLFEAAEALRQEFPCPTPPGYSVPWS